MHTWVCQEGVNPGRPLPSRTLSGGVPLWQNIQHSTRHTVAHKCYLNNISLVSVICKVTLYPLPPLIPTVTLWGSCYYNTLVGASSAVHQMLPYLPLSGHMLRPYFSASLELEVAMWLALINETWTEMTCVTSRWKWCEPLCHYLPPFSLSKCHKNWKHFWW